MTPRALVVRRARIGPAETDFRVEGGRIADAGRGLRRAPGERELDAGGGVVLPGFHDHHLHLLALVAAGRSVPVGPPEVRNRGAFSVALAAAAAARPPGTWIRAVGYHQSVAGDLDRHDLDQAVPDHPVRVQHRSGALWICNSAALAALDAASEPAPGVERDDAGHPTGRLWRMDAWLAARLAPRLGSQPSRRAGDLAGLSAAAAATGVTGWTDATPERPDEDTQDLLAAVAAGAVRQRLHLMLPAGAGAAAVAEIEGVGVTAGPVKIMLDDPNLPALDELCGVIAGAHRRRRPVAVHCVTWVQLALTLAALDEAGAHPGDRIEHGAVIPPEALPALAGRGLTVITQPNFVAERGDDYLSEIPPADIPDLWRGRSLVTAGVRVAAGSDAPFGRPDPWAAVRAAIRRRTGSGLALGRSEAVPPATALSWWSGTGPAPAHRRRLLAGEPADFLVLGAPLTEVLGGDGPVPLVATVVAGEIVHPQEKE